VLESKLGADCNLLWSPLNTKLCSELELELVPLLAELLEPLEGRNNAHGTATCLLPPLEELALGEADELELSEEELLLVSEDEPLEPPPVMDNTAKSTLPEDGLINTSLTVPMVWPEDEVTEALLRSAARTSC